EVAGFAAAAAAEGFGAAVGAGDGEGAGLAGLGGHGAADAGQQLLHRAGAEVTSGSAGALFLHGGEVGGDVVGVGVGDRGGEPGPVEVGGGVGALGRDVLADVGGHDPAGFAAVVGGDGVFGGLEGDVCEDGVPGEDVGFADGAAVEGGGEGEEFGGVGGGQAVVPYSRARRTAARAGAWATRSSVVERRWGVWPPPGSGTRNAPCCGRLAPRSAARLASSRIHFCQASGHDFRWAPVAR